MLETFQTVIGGRFAPLTIMSNEDTDIDSMITTFNTAVTEAASEILVKHRQKKKLWITAEILYLCNKRRELRKKRFGPEGYVKYKKVKSAGVDKIPAELVQAGGKDVITALTTICNKIWQTGEWPTP